jgi:glutamyl-Q tRNA(Asp) synthetase
MRLTFSLLVVLSLKDDLDDSIFTATHSDITICMANTTSRGQMLHHIAYPQIKRPKQDSVVTRFAPSPNGMLHIGHAYAAICAHDVARGESGRFLLRIEDIDATRSRAEYVEAIQTDLNWLGLDWDGDVRFQSARVEQYRTALTHLEDMRLIYKCTCTRGDIAAALKEHSVLHGPDGPHYPGICRGKDVGDAPFCWRLDMAAATAATGMLDWTDLEAGAQFADPAQFGDIVLWRKDAPASYHLAATLDDAADGVTHVVRGRDLFAYTGIHRLLQALLGLPEPVYWHHALLLDESGEKLAKSKASPALAQRRLAGENGVALTKSLRTGQLPLGITRSNP